MAYNPNELDSKSADIISSRERPPSSALCGAGLSSYQSKISKNNRIAKEPEKDAGVPVHAISVVGDIPLTS